MMELGEAPTCEEMCLRLVATRCCDAILSRVSSIRINIFLQRTYPIVFVEVISCPSSLLAQTIEKLSMGNQRRNNLNIPAGAVSLITAHPPVPKAQNRTRHTPQLFLYFASVYELVFHFPLLLQYVTAKVSPPPRPMLYIPRARVSQPRPGTCLRFFTSMQCWHSPWPRQPNWLQRCFVSNDATYCSKFPSSIVVKSMSSSI